MITGQRAQELGEAMKDNPAWVASALCDLPTAEALYGVLLAVCDIANFADIDKDAPGLVELMSELDKRARADLELERPLLPEQPGDPFVDLPPVSIPPPEES